MKPASPRRASLWFAAALYFNSALLLLATPIFTRLLSPAEYGEVVLYTSLSTILGIFATLSLSSGVYNNAQNELSDRIAPYTSSMLVLSTLATLVTLGLTWVLTPWVPYLANLPGTLLAFMFAGFAFNSALLFWQAQQRFNYRYRAVVALGIVGPLVGLGLALAAMRLLPAHKVEARIILAALPNLLAGVWLYVSLMRSGKVLYDRSHWVYALSMGLPLLPHYLAQAVVLQFDRLNIEATLGKSSVGLYGLATAVASGLVLLTTAINTSMVPWMLRQLKEGRNAEILLRTGQLTIGVSLIAAALALLAPEIVRLLAPAGYAAAASVIPALLVAGQLQFVQSILLTLQFNKKRALLITATSLLAASANVAANLWLVPLFGVVAAACALALTQALQVLVHWAISRRQGDLPVIRVGRSVIATASCTTAALWSQLHLNDQPARLAALALVAAATAGLALQLRRKRQ